MTVIRLKLFPWTAGAIHRKRGQDATTVALDQKSLSGFQHSQLLTPATPALCNPHDLTTPQVNLVMNVKMTHLPCEVCGFQVVSRATALHRTSINIQFSLKFVFQLLWLNLPRLR